MVRCTESESNTEHEVFPLSFHLPSLVPLCLLPGRYYEVKLLSEGMMRVGWAAPTFPAGQLLGSDDRSYAFDGYLVSVSPSAVFRRQWGLRLLPPRRPASGIMALRASASAGRKGTLLAVC